MTKVLTLLSLVFICNFMIAQTIQFQFCGKTDFTTPATDTKLRFDFLKIGVRGASQTAPFYVLGNQETATTNDNFKDKTVADNCTNSNGSSGTCSMCNTCTNVESTTALNIGNATGKLTMNCKVETKGNDLFIMSTGLNNVVCYETHKISLVGRSGKLLDVYYKVEGIAKDSLTLRNISLNYRFNNDAYFNTPYFFNNNSRILGVREDIGSLTKSVPVSTENLTKKLRFDLSPNPTQEILKINLSVFEKFDGFINLLSSTGSIVYFEPNSFDPSIKSKEINVSNFPAGNYIVHISDNDGRSSTLKFQKL